MGERGRRDSGEGKEKEGGEEERRDREGNRGRGKRGRRKRRIRKGGRREEIREGREGKGKKRKREGGRRRGVSQMHGIQKKQLSKALAEMQICRISGPIIPWHTKLAGGINVPKRGLQNKQQIKKIHNTTIL